MKYFIDKTRYIYSKENCVQIWGHLKTTWTKTKLWTFSTLDLFLEEKLSKSHTLTTKSVNSPKKNYDFPLKEKISPK